MKWCGTKRVALKSIILPGNFSATRAAPRITELATSIREHGTIAPPVVEAKTNRLIAGHDRVAALLALKETHVDCRVVEGTPREIRRMQIAENLHRRGDDAKALIAEYARAEEAAIIEEHCVEVATGVVTAQRVKQEANAVVAEAKGIKPKSVRQAKRRARVKEEQQVAAPEPVVPEASPEVPLPEGFAAYGIDIPAADREVIAETLAWLKDLESLARRTVAAMTDAEKHRQFSIAPSHVQGIRERAAALGHALREAMPAGLCPYCKFRPALVSNCAGCGGVGVAGRHAGDHVPRELLGAEVVMVAVDGKIVPLTAAKTAKKNGKAILVEVIDAVGAAPRELTLDRTAAEESEELF
jgi:ParB-like chromosome segregation protein Spo0J